MKTGLFLTALVQLAAAQPHHNRHAHLHEKRDAVVTQVSTVTNAVVYADQNGNAYSTSYFGQQPQATAAPAPAAPAPAPANPAPANPAPAAPEHHHKHGHKNHHKSKQESAPEAVVSSGGNGGHHGGSSGGSSSGLGIVYSPYNADNSCKTQDEVNSDFAKIGSGYSMVRIYGVDCDQVTTVGNAAKGMKLFLGVFDLSDVSGDVNTIIQAMKSDWSRVDTVNIGNELVNSGSNSASEVVAAVSQARSQLRSAGYNGPVVTVDTFNAIISNPELCKASDYAAANAHAFFDPTVSAPGAGDWVSKTKNQVQQACNKNTVITECGWPHQGTANGDAIPGVQQQQQALDSIRNNFSSGLILYTAFDDLWKPTDPSTFDAEKYWGMLSGQ